MMLWCRSMSDDVLAFYRSGQGISKISAMHRLFFSNEPRLYVPVLYLYTAYGFFYCGDYLLVEPLDSRAL